MVSLYIHVPFCTRKCDYCHFFVIPDKPDFHAQYLEALSWEWKRQAPLLKDREICSIYFGGGTPSLLGPAAIAHILEWFPRSEKPIEITLEANPENITGPLMQDYRNAGINRVSIGVQSFDDEMLHLLSRQHDAEKARQAILDTEKAGISNISIDLMYDLPKQTLKMWEETLAQACQLPITHLSLYNLTIEPHTAFYKHRTALEPQRPTPKTSRIMYELAIERLSKAGLLQYEISAFARDGLHSIHNTGYWTARPFLGLGPSAFSFWKGKRFRNIAHLNKYHRALSNGDSPIDFEEQLDEAASLRERLAIHLRLLEGINLETFPKLAEETLNALEELGEKGLVQWRRNHVQLTDKGILFYDTVASELV